MKQNWLRRIGVFALVLLLSIFFTACGGEGGADGGETYVYLAEFTGIPEITERIHATTLHEGRIYFTYVETYFPEGYADEETLSPPVSTIVLGSMLPDGEIVSRIEIPNAGTIVDVGGLRITQEGNVALIFTDSDWEVFGVRVFYAEYSPAGEDIHRREIPGLVPAEATRFHLSQALFMDDGNIIEGGAPHEIFSHPQTAALRNYLKFVSTP